MSVQSRLPSSKRVGRWTQPCSTVEPLPGGGQAGADCRQPLSLRFHPREYRLWHPAFPPSDFERRQVQEQ